jgi:Ni,Fe-hydrogenase III large subunit
MTVIPGLELSFARLTAPLPVWRTEVSDAQWTATARAVAEGGGRLVALWGTERGGRCFMSAAYAVREGLALVELPLEGAAYPDLSGVFPCAVRMQRAAADLLGVRASGASDMRPWLNHGGWPAEWYPLQTRCSNEQFAAKACGNYPFVRVEGDGVHEIPVGPVHAGIIEPGHFRFSIVGEKVLRLEQRLGYKHKGVERLFTMLSPQDGARLAGRISGDTTVAYAWAYCMALESIREVKVPERALWLRALLLERERVANHLGDLGALGNDAAFAFGLAQFSRLKEDWLRLNRELFGHRYLMDCVVPGGTAIDLNEIGKEQLREQCDALESEVHTLKGIYDEHAGLQDRFLTTGRVAPPLAAQLNLTGLAGRASAQSFDLRADYPMTPYDRLNVHMVTHRGGDVAARVTVRFEEALESLRVIRELVSNLPAGSHRSPVAAAGPGGLGAGWIEGWRGEVLVILELPEEGTAIRRCHCHDPSWQNWPVLEHAVIGNIVPDFPLINKSFNLSYSGHDL